MKTLSSDSVDAGGEGMFTIVLHLLGVFGLKITNEIRIKNTKHFPTHKWEGRIKFLCILRTYEQLDEFYTTLPIFIQVWMNFSISMCVNILQMCFRCLDFRFSKRLARLWCSFYWTQSVPFQVYLKILTAFVAHVFAYENSYCIMQHAAPTSTKRCCDKFIGLK